MKIKCPHCGAVNQDVTENDPCWQCGTILSAPTSALDTGTGPPASAANPGSAPTAQAAQTTDAQATTTPSPATPPAQPPPRTIQRPGPKVSFPHRLGPVSFAQRRLSADGAAPRQ